MLHAIRFTFLFLAAALALVAAFLLLNTASLSIVLATGAGDFARFSREVRMQVFWEEILWRAGLLAGVWLLSVFFRSGAKLMEEPGEG